MHWGTPAAAFCAFWFASGIACAQDQAPTTPPAAAQENTSPLATPAAPPPDATQPTPPAQTSAAAASSSETPNESSPQTVSPLLKDAVRLSPTPDFSLLIPKGWYDCNPNDNKLLGEVSVSSSVVSAFCAGAISTPTVFRAIDPTAGRRQAALAMFVNDGTLTPQYFDDASPLALKAFTKKLCNAMQSTASITNASVAGCNLSPTKIAGRNAVAGSATLSISGRADPVLAQMIGVPMMGRMLLFEVVELDKNADDGVAFFDAIVNSIVVSDGSSPQLLLAPIDPGAPLQGAVRVSPLPGVSIMVPKGWISCDGKNSHDLGQDALPPEFVRAFCSENSFPAAQFYVRYPSETRMMAAVATAQTIPGASPKMFVAMEEKVEKVKTGGFCTSIHVSNGCQSSLSYIDGHPVLIVTASNAIPEGLFILTMHMVVIPLNGQVVTVSVTDTDMAPEITNPVVNAMIKSITIH